MILTCIIIMFIIYIILFDIKQTKLSKIEYQYIGKKRLTKWKEKNQARIFIDSKELTIDCDLNYLTYIYMNDDHKLWVAVKTKEYKNLLIDYQTFNNAIITNRHIELKPYKFRLYNKEEEF